MIYLNEQNLIEYQSNNLTKELERSGIVGDIRVISLPSAIVIWRKVRFSDNIDLLYERVVYDTFPHLEFSFLDTSIEVFSQRKTTGILGNSLNVYGKDFIAENKTTRTKFLEGDSYFGVVVMPSLAFVKQLLERDVPSSEKLYKEIFVQSAGGILNSYVTNNVLSNLANLMYEYTFNRAFNEEFLDMLTREFIGNSYNCSLSKPTDYDLAIHAIKTLKNPSLQLVAEHLGISERTVNNIFYKNGSTFRNVRKQIILEKANQLLEMDYSPEEIAKKLGYASVAYFKKILNLK